MATSWRGYREVLAVPGVVPLTAVGFAGRLGYGMISLPALLLIAERFGGFGIAGIALAGYGVGATLAPVRGRLVDRFGGLALVIMAVAHTVLIVPALWLPTSAPWAAVVLATLAGVCAPVVGAVARRGWSARLTEASPDLRSKAFSFDSVVEELCFVLGPALAGLVVAVSGADVALVAAALLLLAGSLGLAVVAAPRQRTASAEGGTGAPTTHPRLAGPARATVLRAALSVVTLGAAIGLVDVGVPALALDQGHVGWSGPLLALYTVGSLIGVVVAGSRHAADLDRRRVALGLAQVVLLVPLVFARSPAALALALVVAGLPLAALYTTCYLLVDRDVPLESATQAYAWVNVAASAMGALATAAGGLLVEGWGAGAPLVVAPLAAAVPAGLAALTARRARVPSSP